MADAAAIDDEGGGPAEDTLPGPGAHTVAVPMTVIVLAVSVITVERLETGRGPAQVARGWVRVQECCPYMYWELVGGPLCTDTTTLDECHCDTVEEVKPDADGAVHFPECHFRLTLAAPREYALEAQRFLELAEAVFGDEDLPEDKLTPQR